MTPMREGGSKRRKDRLISSKLPKGEVNMTHYTNLISKRKKKIMCYIRVRQSISSHGKRAFRSMWGSPTDKSMKFAGPKRAIRVMSLNCSYNIGRSYWVRKK